jgi:hypothetical protein
MEHHFEPEVYRQHFGIDSNEDIAFAEEVLQALQKIDRALVPRSYTHPYMEQIRAGHTAVDGLLEALDAPIEGTTTADVLDALSYIYLNEEISTAASQKIQGYLGDEDLAPIAARCLAIGRDHSFLLNTMEGLSSDDPGVVASAAMLMGYGRFEEAVPVLLPLLSPLRFVESRSVIWALGEIGSEEAIPRLTRALSEHFRPVDCLISLGKIGAITSLGALTPHVMGGARELRETALKSLSMILSKQNDLTFLAPLRESMEGLLTQIATEDPSNTARFYALLSLSRLGVKWKQNQLRRSLNMSLPEEQIDAFANFYLRKR